MSTNKNASIRYYILDKCFRDTKNKYTIYDLIYKCEEGLKCMSQKTTISKRQIYKDIEHMKSRWQIELDDNLGKEDGKSYYRYKDPNFSIYNIPLTEEQYQQIQATIDTLSSIWGLPQFDGLRDCFSKLEVYSIKTDIKPCLSLEHNPYFSGLEYLTPLFNAIQNSTVLKIHYHDYGEDKPQNLIFHPQYLKQYNNRWFVFGCIEERPNKIRKLLLDCIEGLEPAPKYEYRKLDIEWNEYFEDIVGVSIPKKEAVKVHFIVHGKTSKYIENNPINGEQINKRINDDTLDVCIKKIIINKELERILLSYAPDITILEPQSLADKHKKDLEEALRHYEK